MKQSRNVKAQLRVVIKKETLCVKETRKQRLKVLVVTIRNSKILKASLILRGNESLKSCLKKKYKQYKQGQLRKNKQRMQQSLKQLLLS